MDHDTAPAARPATLAGWGLGLAVAAFVATALANVAWGWAGTAGALYSVGTLILVVSLILLVVTQLQLSRVHGGLGKAAAIGLSLIHI